MLQLTNVNAGYGQIQVIRNVSLNVDKGEIVCLIGSNGVGKTTLLRAISGVVPTRSGQLSFDGERIDNLPAYEVVTRGIAHVPEGRRLFGTMSIHDNLLMGAFRRSSASEIKSNLERVYAMFPRLAERRDQAAGTLSGGEQQMCAIGRGLMSEPKILLIDELSLGLAPQMVDMLATTLVQIRDLGISILLVEQDVEIAFELASRGYLLDTGQIAVAASTAELAESPQVKLAYMGG
jgi:branched-chain amino acid transport system ATP-binding protein